MRSHFLWTEEQILYLKTHSQQPIKQIAIEVNHTYNSIATMRYKLGIVYKERRRPDLTKRNLENNPMKSIESRKKSSNTHKNNYNSGREIAYWKNKKKPLEARLKLSLTRKRLFKEGKLHSSNEGKKLLWLTERNLINNPMKGKHHTEEEKKKMSLGLRKKWNDPEFKQRVVRKIMLSNYREPNRQESYLDKILSTNSPNEYKYVGNGEFILGGKCPDFMNINGKKKVIELFGDYWHKGENPQEKIDHYKKYGFNCLVIWQHELYTDEVYKKLENFSKIGEDMC